MTEKQLTFEDERINQLLEVYKATIRKEHNELRFNILLNLYRDAEKEIGQAS